MRIFIKGLIILLGCTSNVQHKENSSIQGTWILQEKGAINYPKIIFKNDSTAVFRSEGDTIYRFTYLLNGSDLVLKDLSGTQETFHIIRLTTDSLIFKTLRENQNRQIYLKEQ
jgi:hypothetical protein